MNRCFLKLGVIISVSLSTFGLVLGVNSLQRTGCDPFRSSKCGWLKSKAGLLPRFALAISAQANLWHFDRQHGIIVVPEDRIINSDPFRAIETVAVEGRLAYEYYAVHHPEIHNNPGEVDIWRIGFQTFLSAVDVGFEIFRLQPLISDALGYAGEVLSAIFQF